MSPSPSTGSRESRSQAPPPSEQPASHRLLRSQTQNDRSPVTSRHLFLDLKSRIISARGPGDIRVKDIPPEIGLLVARSLRDDAEVEGRCHRISYNPVTCYFEIVMPSPTHEALAGWIRIEFEDARVTRFFTRPESLTIIYQPSLSIDSFTGRWANAYKEPDSALMYLNSSMPSVVFETGLTESYPRLLSHKDLWLLGGAPNVNVVLLLKLNKRSNNRVAAFLELHRAGAAAPTRVDVFPAPPPFTPTQYVTFYRKDFYPRGRVPPDRNANDAWNWNVDSFRWLLTNVMSSEGLVPA